MIFFNFIYKSKDLLIKRYNNLNTTSNLKGISQTEGKFSVN